MFSRQPVFYRRCVVINWLSLYLCLPIYVYDHCMCSLVSGCILAHKNFQREARDVFSQVSQCGLPCFAARHAFDNHLVSCLGLRVRSAHVHGEWAAGRLFAGSWSHRWCPGCVAELGAYLRRREAVRCGNSNGESHFVVTVVRLYFCTSHPGPEAANLSVESSLEIENSRPGSSKPD